MIQLMMTALILVCGVCVERASAEISVDPVRCNLGSEIANRIAVSPDGRVVATGGIGGTVRLWDSSKGQQIGAISLEAAANGEGSIQSFAFSPTGNRLAIAPHGKSVQFFDVQSTLEIDGTKQVPVEFGAFDLSYSPDGTQLAVADGKVTKVWELESCKCLHELRFKHSDRVGRVWRARYSPDGRMLGVALQDSGGRTIRSVPRVRVWDVADYRERLTVREDNGSCQSISFSADNKLLAEASRGYPGQSNVWEKFPGAVFVWDIQSQHLKYRVPADKVQTTCVSFCPRGDILATGGHDPAIKLWAAADGKRLGALDGHKAPIVNLAFSNDGNVLVSLDTSNQVLIWTVSQITSQLSAVAGMPDK